MKVDLTYAEIKHLVEVLGPTAAFTKDGKPHPHQAFAKLDDALEKFKPLLSKRDSIRESIRLAGIELANVEKELA